MNKHVVYPELSYKVCGLCFSVHNKLGRYRNEKQYADALEQFLKANQVRYAREMHLPTSFQGEKKGRNVPDFIIDNNMIVDLKAKPVIGKDDYFQMMRYLVSYKKKLGLIFNFRQKYLRPKRILNREVEI